MNLELQILGRRLLALSLFLAAFAPLHAFPPAPPHVIYGTLRDELGMPLSVNTKARIVLETMTGVSIQGQINADAEPGVNYRLFIPMDSGLTADLYQPNALQPMVPFRISVIIGTVVHLPMEMVARTINLGSPGESTRIDLTLGADTDGDGLPDAWERQLIAAMGGNLTLADIQPGDDPDHDGMSNYAEYVAGTYAFDPQDGFSLKISGLNSQGASLLEFLAISNHTYTVMASADLTTWVAVGFRIPETDPESAIRESFTPTDVRTLHIEVPAASPGEALRFFKLMVR